MVFPGKGSCNSSNYAEYAALYNTTTGTTRTNGSGSVNTSDPSFNDADYACYAKNALQNQRDKLDPQIAELHNHPNSIRNVSEMNFDATMLSGVLWVMLGTTALYYAFTKI